MITISEFGKQINKKVLGTLWKIVNCITLITNPGKIGNLFEITYKQGRLKLEF